MSVDAFLEKKVLPQYREVVETFRRLMREIAPDAQETMYRGIPACKRKGVLAVISPTKTGITFSFAQGAKFEDKYGLLEGPSEVSRVVRFKSLDAKGKDALEYYIKQAVAFDSN